MQGLDVTMKHGRGLLVGRNGPSEKNANGKRLLDFCA